MKCPICDKKKREMKYPISDRTTGWTFCDYHLAAVLAKIEKNSQITFSDWLKTIAITRNIYYAGAEPTIEIISMFQ